jgi:hypothetical protein
VFGAKDAARATVASYNVGMSKADVERAMDSVVEFLEDIGDAVRLNDDAKMKELCGAAARNARDLKAARQQMHSYWQEK